MWYTCAQILEGKKGSCCIISPIFVLQYQVFMWGMTLTWELLPLMTISIWMGEDWYVSLNWFMICKQGFIGGFLMMLEISTWCVPHSINGGKCAMSSDLRLNQSHECLQALFVGCINIAKFEIHRTLKMLSSSSRPGVQGRHHRLQNKWAIT
jgi:hypothetical protein